MICAARSGTTFHTTDSITSALCSRMIFSNCSALRAGTFGPAGAGGPATGAGGSPAHSAIPLLLPLCVSLVFFFSIVAAGGGGAVPARWGGGAADRGHGVH